MNVPIGPGDYTQKRKKVWWPLFIRIILGLVFVVASVDKIRHPSAFAEVIYNYQILPEQFINIAAIVLPWLELFLGGCLLLGVWLPGAVVLTNMLLFSFFAALLFNIARGLDIACGCFSTSSEHVGGAIMVWYVLRDLFFLFLGGYLLFRLHPGRLRATNERIQEGVQQ